MRRPHIQNANMLLRNDPLNRLLVWDWLVRSLVTHYLLLTTYYLLLAAYYLLLTTRMGLAGALAGAITGTGRLWVRSLAQAACGCDPWHRPPVGAIPGTGAACGCDPWHRLPVGVAAVQPWPTTP